MAKGAGLSVTCQIMGLPLATFCAIAVPAAVVRLSVYVAGQVFEELCHLLSRQGSR